jgi:hypothetical protein
MFESVYRPTGRMNEFGGVYLAALNTYGDSHLCDRCSAIIGRSFPGNSFSCEKRPQPNGLRLGGALGLCFLGGRNFSPWCQNVLLKFWVALEDRAARCQNVHPVAHSEKQSSASFC